MFLRNNLMFALVLLLSMVLVSCSGGGTTPSQGGDPDDNNNIDTRVSGTVTLDGAPVNGAEVAAYNVTNGSLAGNYTTGTDGVYKLDPVGGQYIVVAVSEAGYINPEYINLADDNSSHRMDLQMNRFQNQVQNGYFFCRVLNEKDNTPIVNADVQVGEFKGRSDAWGFCFMKDIPQQDLYKFDLKASGFNARSQEVRRNQMIFDRNLILRAELFKLTPMSGELLSIGGQVRDISSGFDLGGAFVTLEKPLDTSFTPVTFMTNLGGNYRFYNLQGGTYVFKTQRTGYLDEENQVIINDKEGYFTIFLTPDTEQLSSLSGFVYDSTGQLVLPNVTVSVSNPLFGIKQETISDGNGKFTFTGLVFGDYTIKATPPTPLFLSQWVALTLDEADQQMQFNLAFNDSGAVMGSVTVTGMTMLPTGAKVTAEKIGAPMSGLKFENNVDGNGKYAINGMLAGVYLLKVELEYAKDKKTEAIEPNVQINAGSVTVKDFELTPIP